MGCRIARLVVEGEVHRFGCKKSMKNDSVELPGGLFWEDVEAVEGMLRAC